MKKQLNDPVQRLSSKIRHSFVERTHVEAEGNFRIVLYSHDTMGVGHMRRNLLIANQIRREFPNASILVIAGAREAVSFAQKAGIDCLTLPAFQKTTSGKYSVRDLGISTAQMIELRTQTILGALSVFRPDLFIVDKLPAGAGGELLPVLESLSQTDCQLVLGLREILDSHEIVAAEWKESFTVDVIRRYFQTIWIYGDPNVYNAVEEYDFPSDIADRACFTGYLNPKSRLDSGAKLPFDVQTPYVLCTVGGGQDGYLVARNFVDAIQQNPRPSVLLTGPYMPVEQREELIERASKTPELRVIQFVTEGDILIKNASHVVCMGGYNTIAAVLSHRKQAMVIPRISPRQEQWLRANRLANKGILSTVSPDEVTPQHILSWLDSDQTWSNDCHIDLSGLTKITEWIHSNFPNRVLQSAEV